MSFRDLLKAKLGAQLYARVDAEGVKEVSLAMSKVLTDQDGHEVFHRPRALLKEFAKETEHFDAVGLHVLPADVTHVLFRCKLLRATLSDNEFRQRGGQRSFSASGAIFPVWNDRTLSMDALEDKYLDGLQSDVYERTLLSHISSLNPDSRMPSAQQAFFEDLFASLSLPFVAFVDDDLVEKHKHFEPSLPSYTTVSATRFFSAPSIGCTVVGTENYCFVYASSLLRTFLNLLRIAAYIYPAQAEFDLGKQIEPPTYPVFLGQNAMGSYQWAEDQKESWEKHPDGCLFRSWGFRSISNMWLDRRNYAKVKKFFSEHKKIVEAAKTPFSNNNMTDIAPTLDILSSATQVPDLGAKLLLIYCCLEHLFVPSDAGAENSKYILGGLKALQPQLIPWFREALYPRRNAYAHKGFVIRDEKTLQLIKDSLQNAVMLLTAKLSIA